MCIYIYFYSEFAFGTIIKNQQTSLVNTMNKFWEFAVGDLESAAAQVADLGRSFSPEHSVNSDDRNTLDLVSILDGIFFPLYSSGHNFLS